MKTTTHVGFGYLSLASLFAVALTGCAIHLHVHIKETHEHREYRMIDIIKGDVDPLADSAGMIETATKEILDGFSQ